LERISLYAENMADGLRKPLYNAEKLATPATVCVSGGTGYIAGAIIKRLLAMGMTVHATVRDPDNKDKLEHLLSFPGAASRLKFFKVGIDNYLLSLLDYVVTSYTIRMKPTLCYIYSHRGEA
jgi:NmrA-like family